MTGVKELDLQRNIDLSGPKYLIVTPRVGVAAYPVTRRHDLNGNIWLPVSFPFGGQGIIGFCYGVLGGGE